MFFDDIIVNQATSDGGGHNSSKTGGAKPHGEFQTSITFLVHICRSDNADWHDRSVIHSVARMAGTQADLGVQERNGVQMAVEKINVGVESMGARANCLSVTNLAFLRKPSP